MRHPLLLAAGLVWAAAAAAQTTIVSSKHDLSVSGKGPVRAATETQICIFCHVGHSQRPRGDNRPDVRSDYVPYQSSTLQSVVPSSPTGATRTCLSCHDGTIALGETVASGTIQMLATAPGGRLAPGAASNLGTDLRRTHPVSFVPAPGAKVRSPSPESPAKLDRTGAVQCTSCHDPHSELNDPVRGMFLLGSNRFSQLCLACHAMEYWNSNPGAHQSSMAVVHASKSEQVYPYGTVGENGCEACHRSHNAGESGRLLRAKATEPEETVCLGCHNGRVAATDLTRDLAKPFAHAMPAGSPRAHDAAERPEHPVAALPETRTSAPRHVTCVDCHNPHAAFRQPAVGPGVGGALAGVWGIDQRGERVEPVQFEYEVCFKCHADSANQPRAKSQARHAPRREDGSQNLRLALASDAPSAHPVVRAGRGADAPSLVAPYTSASLVTCTACHASDTGPSAGGQGAAGPHGSSYDFLLERNLSTADYTAESPLAYALCYKCHDREVVLSDRSAFPLHRKHVVDASTPCTGCHASHGVPATVGAPEAHAHLMDYDVGIVGPGPRGAREYRSRGRRAGVCSTSCHGVVHDDATY